MKDLGNVIGAGKLAVITGAASGIGLAAARRFAAAGMRVVLVDAAAKVEERQRRSAAMPWRSSSTCPTVRPWSGWRRKSINTSGQSRR